MFCKLCPQSKIAAKMFGALGRAQDNNTPFDFSLCEVCGKSLGSENGPGYQNLVYKAETLLREARKWQQVVRNSLIEEEKIARTNRNSCLKQIVELLEQGQILVGYANNERLQKISSTAHDIQNL